MYLQFGHKFNGTKPLKISISAIGDFLVNWVIPGKTIQKNNNNKKKKKKKYKIIKFGALKYIYTIHCITVMLSAE